MGRHVTNIMGSWINFRDPAEIFKVHKEFLFLEYFLYLLAGLSLVHAIRHGRRNVFFIMSCIGHAFMVEIVCYISPDADCFWHAISSIQLFFYRLPVYILCVYVVFYYSAMVLASRLKLGLLAESVAVGLIAVLIDFPYDILGPKFLWWTWDATDPNIRDRSYHIPWNSFLFHLTFAFSLNLILNSSRNLITKTGSRDIAGKSLFLELIPVLLASVTSFPLGVMIMTPTMNIPRILYDVHAENCFMITAFIAVYLVFRGVRNNVPRLELTGKWRNPIIDEVVISMVAYFLFMGLMVVYGDPLQVKSTGVHQTLGDCTITQDVYTPIGVALPKNPFLCVPKNYSAPQIEEYFDYKCLAAHNEPLPKSGENWYTICGNAYPNKAAYIHAVFGVALLGILITWELGTNAAKGSSNNVVNQVEKKKTK